MKRDCCSVFRKWMKFSSSYTILIILFAERSFAQDMDIDNVTAVAEEVEFRRRVVSNLQANAFYDEDMDEIHLNITWSNPPDSGTKLNTWHIAQSLLFDDGNNYCHRGFALQELIEDSGSSSIIIEDEHFPNCTYKVTILGEQMADVDARYIVYTVPDCVDNKCICHFQATFSDAPDISVKQISNHVIRIFWEIPELNTIANVSTISFKVFQRGSSKKMASLTRNVTTWCASQRCEDDVTIPGMTVGASYSVEASYVGAMNCKSETSFLTFHARDVAEFQWVLQVIIPLMFMAILLLLMWFLIKRINMDAIGRFSKRTKIPVPMVYNNTYIQKENLEALDEYEMSYTQLHLGSEIGNGAFGQVFLARLPPCIIVAVKTLKKNASTEELDNFLLEIAMLKQIGRHPNIVTLFGCCTIQQPYCIVMEYIPCGDLLHYLHGLRTYYERNSNRFHFDLNDPSTDNSRKGNKEKLSDDLSIAPPSIPFNRLPSITETMYTDLSSPGALECVLDPRDLQNFAVQIARGMRHLEQNQIVHRDLAARNVLIDENKTLKISDFGLSRKGVYVNSKQKKIPLRWMSVEAIRDCLYTSKSDVWAYGVVLWEIGTLGGFPYPNISNEDILGFLLSGNRMEKPDNCSDELYALMVRSWSLNEDERPSFTELLEDLEAISSKRRVYVGFSQLNPVYMFPPKAQLCSDVSDNKCEDVDIEIRECKEELSNI